MTILVLLLLLFNIDDEINTAENQYVKRLNIALSLIQNDYNANIFLFNGAYQPIKCFKVDSTIDYSMLFYPLCGEVINYYLDTSKFTTLAERVRYLRKQEVERKQGYVPKKIDLSKIDRYASDCQFHISIEIIHNNIYYMSLSSLNTDGRVVVFYFVFDEQDSVIYSKTNYAQP